MKPFSIHDAGLGETWETFTLSRGESDYCSRDGATALKEKIEAYWRARGQEVIIALHNVGFHPAIRAARFDVRSDMVNGMPRGVSGEKRPSSAPVQSEYFGSDDLAVD